MEQSLQSLLTQQVDNLNQLAVLLEQELHLISSRDAEALMTLLKEKEQTLEEIQQLDQTVNKLYSDLVATGSIPAEIENLIADAKALLEQCQYRTQVNQKAVEQGQLRLTHLRNLMLEVRAKESLTYDKSGKPKPGSTGKGVSA
ncbi:flagella synthesis protein FlgN [Alteromonas sp. ASW11-130]|uniref:flagella synthesis protein FlgN n=1 Tax=Alteromonas sp. ASW11-130 TaxID=3015775 RepID=UPI002242C04D|nr:flagellar protein FlgN [Alteromonas sp. ASW11-130]MCW8091821.1 flagellar protein FlgN [Alteromonas sp. ASW11-130]